ncbi:glutaredoxin family protein [Rhodoferax sp. 4810]|nr:glutaredoxin family protein [Rhodoferax jenense]
MAYLLYRVLATGCLWVLAGWLSGTVWASTVPANADIAASTPASELVVYVRDGCPHCADAKQFLAQVARERPRLQVSLRAVDQDPAARDELIALSRRAGVWPPGVPTFSLAGRVLVGFGSTADSGPELLAWIDQAATPPPDQVKSRLFGTLNASQLGLPLFTLALGLLDGFNPCAMWVLLFLLSLLVRLQNRRRMALVAGTFVLVSGAVYYAFMAAWLNIFLAVGLSTPVRWALASLALLIGAVNVKDFVAWGRGFSLSIPASVKPGIYARVRGVLGAQALPGSLLAVAVLAVVVNFVELLCTAGLPALYTAVLTQQGAGAAAHYAYLGLYILGYLADDTLMVTMAVVALSHRKLTEDTGRWLKLLSGLVMLALGLVLLLRPDWLL